MGQIIHIMVISFQRNKTLRCLTQIPQIPQMAAHPRPQYYAQSKSVESAKSVVKYNFRNLNNNINEAFMIIRGNSCKTKKSMNIVR